VSGARKARTVTSVDDPESRTRDVILNRQRNVRFRKSQLESFMARARKALGLPAGALSVALVTNAEIAKWNRAYRHKHGPTDVLSFPAEPALQAPRRIGGGRRPRTTAKTAAPRYLGDIAIAPAVAQRNARRFGRTFFQEMRILILHGMLHLMGYDHETDAGQMERRERRLRRELGID